MTNLTIPETINIMELFTWANVETNSYLGIVLVFIVFSCMLIILLRKGELLFNAIGISSFFGLIICSIFVAIELISPVWLIYFIAGIIISVMVRLFFNSD